MMYRVIFTWHPRGRPEQSREVMMPMIPIVGQAIHFDDENLPAMRVKFTSLVQDRPYEWHAEVSLT